MSCKSAFSVGSRSRAALGWADAVTAEVENGVPACRILCARMRKVVDVPRSILVVLEKLR